MSREFLPRIADRVFGVPLMIEPRKLRTIVHVLGERIGVDVEPPRFELASRMDRMRERTDLRIEDGGVAVIEIHGSLVHRHDLFSAFSGMTSYETIGVELEKAVEDPQVRAILLEVDSPGGEVNGVFDLADKIRMASEEKPVWAIAADFAASAAYLLGSAADRLFVSQTGVTGSIGVIALRWDETGALEAEGLSVTEIFAGARKTDGSPLHQITDDELRALQGRVNTIYDLFTAKVADYRELEEEAVRETEAAVFIGQAGVDVGLADGIATTELLLAQLSEQGRGRPSVAAVMTTEDGMEKDEGKAPEITAAYVAENHPEVAEHFRAEGRTAGLETGRDEGAESERERIRSIEALGTSGHRELVDELKYDPEMTAETAALRIVTADGERRAGQIEKLRGDEQRLEAPAPSTDADARNDDEKAAALILHAGRPKQQTA